MSKVTIDGVEYEYEKLSKEAQQQIANIRVTDERILRAEQDLAILRTARVMYSNNLADILKKGQEKAQLN